MNYKFDRERVLKWIFEKNPTIQCPICDAQSWVMPKRLVVLKENPGRIKGVPIPRCYPMALLICDECGHAMFFDITASEREDEREPDNQINQPIPDPTSN